MGCQRVFSKVPNSEFHRIPYFKGPNQGASEKQDCPKRIKKNNMLQLAMLS